MEGIEKSAHKCPKTAMNIGIYAAFHCISDLWYDLYSTLCSFSTRNNNTNLHVHSLTYLPYMMMFILENVHQTTTKNKTECCLKFMWWAFGKFYYCSKLILNIWNSVGWFWLCMRHFWILPCIVLCTSYDFCITYEIYSVRREKAFLSFIDSSVCF